MGTLQIGAVPGESGTSVEFQSPNGAAPRAPFGSSGLIGAFEWGPIDRVVVHPGEGHYKAIRGREIREDHTPTNAAHFYGEARGSGQLMTLRLVDGDEAKAYRDVYARDISLSYVFQTPHTPPTRVLRMEGLYPGKRGGVADIYTGRVADFAAATDIAAGTFATGNASWVQDQWKYASLYFEGSARAYKVLGNTTAGVLKIEIPSGSAAPPASPAQYTIVLETPDQDNVRRGFGVRFDRSTQAPTSEFALDVYDFVDRQKAGRDYESLSLDATAENFVEDLVNTDGARDLQMAVQATAYDPGDPSDETAQPANWVGLVVPESGSANTVTVRTSHWTRTVAAGGNAYLHPGTIVYPTRRVRCKAVCTFTAATAFNVV